MRKLIYIIAFFLIGKMYGQKNVKFLPYSVNNLYGLVNDEQKQIIAPKFKKLKIIGNYAFALFDNKYCYDLNNGKSVEISLTQNIYLVIIENGLYLFNSVSNSMTNPFSKEKINLKVKYLNFYNKTLYDIASNKEFKVIMAQTSDKKNVFLINSKSLIPAIKGKFEYDEFDFISIFDKGSEREIGIMTRKNKAITCYNYNCTKSLNLSDTDYDNFDEYSINFKKEVSTKFIKLFGYVSDNFPQSFSLEGKLRSVFEGKYFNSFINKIELGNGLSLIGNSSDYDLQSKKALNSEKVIFNGIYFFDRKEEHNYIEFKNVQTNENIHFFVNHNRINPEILMLPKEKLLELGLI